MQHDLGVSSGDVTWLVTAYFLVASIATPIFGRLGDMFGKERYLAVSLALFAAGSVVCAVGDSLALMIVGRGLQGMGGGVFPLSFGIVRDEFPRERVPSGIALLGAVAGIGGAIGLPLGGLLADQVGFHWIFWLSAAMGVVSTIAIVKFVPESPVRTPGKLDLAGAGILAVGLSGVLIGISRANDWGWGSTKTLGLIAAGLVVLALFVQFERRHDQPLINMRTMARRPVLTTNLSTLLVGFGLFGTFVLVPQLAELPEATGYGFGLNATVAGLLMAPGGLMMILVAPLVGRIGERSGSKLPLVVGCLVAAVGLVGMALRALLDRPDHPLGLHPQRRRRRRLRRAAEPDRAGGRRARDRRGDRRQHDHAQHRRLDRLAGRGLDRRRPRARERAAGGPGLQARAS